MCQLILAVLGRHELVKDVTSLDASWRKVAIIIFKGFDCDESN
jgi:hypothetical protein